jgi:DNA primase
MENKQLVLGLLESILGKGMGSKSGSNFTFHCPFCNHYKPKLTVNVSTGVYNCWTCNPATKGSSIPSLLKKIKAPDKCIAEMQGYFPKSIKIISETEQLIVSLPEEFTPLSTPDKSIEYRHAMAYVKRRGLTNTDISKYNVGYCDSGRYRNKVIVPSYDSTGKINYFIARSYDSESTFKIDAPSCNKNDIIGFEYYVNWQVPVILCEGVFDAMAIKRNAIPLFGKSISKALMMKLIESEVKTVYLALDKDAIKEALKYAQKLLNIGKEVYLIDLEGKDPSDIGFDSMIGLLQNARPITFKDMFLQKIQLV